MIPYQCDYFFTSHGMTLYIIIIEGKPKHYPRQSVFDYSRMKIESQLVHW